MIRIIVLSVMATICLTSCFLNDEKIRGNGVLKTESRNASGFNSVDVNGNIDVYLKQDSVYSVRIEADENLMEFIIIRTEGNTLVIEPEKGTNLSGNNDIKVFVSGPSFIDIDVSGASSVTSENQLSAERIELDVFGASSARLEINAPAIDADIEGASTITIKGRTKDLSIEASGASHAKCFDLLSENADVDASGASGAEVFASVSVKADASGASHVKYKGATTHTGSASGAGSITKVN